MFSYTERDGDGKHLGDRDKVCSPQPRTPISMSMVGAMFGEGGSLRKLNKVRGR